MAEHASRTFKNHFIAILSMVDFNSPLAEGDILLPHAVITLNILHSSLIHPCRHMHPFLVTSTQSSTSCTTRKKVAAHTAADKCHSLAPHSRVGRYTGLSPKHCRCHHNYFPDTMAECELLKVKIFPEKLLFLQFLLWTTSSRQQLICYSF